MFIEENTKESSELGLALDAAMIRIDFNRQTGLATHPGFEGWGGAFEARAPDGYFDVIRDMVDAGYPDGPATFHDERGMACLTVLSIHACKRRYRPTEADKAARELKRKAAKHER